MRVFLCFTLCQVAYSRKSDEVRRTAEQLTLIFALVCEAVEESGRPVTRWTQREIIDKAGFHRLLQRYHGKALSMDLHRPTA